MTSVCPYCGVSLPAVRDAYCFNCRESLDDDVAQEASAERGDSASPCPAIVTPVLAVDAGNLVAGFSGLGSVFGSVDC
jgi:hypothetical protein